MNLQTASDKHNLKIVWEDKDSDFEALESSADFEKLFNQTSANAGGGIREGSIVTGRIVRISKDFVALDIGHKSEGEVPANEFSSEELSTLKVGDTVEVFLDRFEDHKGEMVLSKERAQILKAWDRVSDAFKNEEVIEGTVISRVKGGLSVDIGIKAFLPGSQVDIRPVRNLDKLIGGKLQFKIIKFHKARGNIVLSRKVLLEMDREKQRSVTLETIKEGAKLRGMIKGITDYGAFVDLGGVDGLLYITEMSWGRISHPSDLFEVGQEIDVVVLSFDEAKQRVSLGYKQLQDDPWSKVETQFQVGQRTKGKVLSVTDFGAFIELEGGIEGLVHVSEMTWSKRVKHPSKIVQVDDQVEVVILGVDKENRKISLGMKQIEPNPWDVVREKYQVGDVIRGKIRNITDFGIFVGIEEGIDGLIHISDISWTERIKHPSDLFKKGDEVEAKILQIDSDEEKFSLGIKQNLEDPFVTVAKTLVPGSKGSGKITKITEFGAFVELAPGVEGMIHISEVADQNIVRIEEVLKEGETVEFMVLAADTADRRFTLSRKALLKNLDGEKLKEYIATVAEPKTAFADAFTRAQNTNTQSDS